MAKTSSNQSKTTKSNQSAKGPALKQITRRRTRPELQLVIPVIATTETDFVRFELKESNDGASIDEGTGRFRWTPGRDESGIYVFTVLATDSEGASSSLMFEVEVEDNQSPTITAIADQTIAVGDPFSYQVEADDPEGETLTYDLINGGIDLTISESGLITGSPPSPGTTFVEVEVTDPQGASAVESFDLTVTNEPPTITAIADKTISVGDPFSYQVQANDPEGQTLTYNLINGGIDLTISEDGLITGSPPSPGTTFVEVEVTDPHGASAVESFDLTVTNEPPTITAIADKTISVGDPFSYQVQANDPEGQTLTYNLINGGMDLTISGGGLITGTPASPGTISVEVEVTDPHGAFARESFDLTVTNEPPTITAIADQTISVGDPFSYQVQASDPEGQTLTYNLINGGMDLMISGGGLITGTPASPGTTAVEVEVTDPHGAFARESFDLTVTNEPPTITAIADQTISIGDPFSYQVQANDPEGQTLTYNLINGGMDLMISGGGLITGTPASPGTTAVEVEVTDPHGAFARESFDLTVTNEPPTITAIADQTISVGDPFSYQVQANDPEGQTLTYNLINGGMDLTISGGGLITGTPASPGTITVEVEVTDPHGAFARESFDLTVE